MKLENRLSKDAENKVAVAEVNDSTIENASLVSFSNVVRQVPAPTSPCPKYDFALKMRKVCSYKRNYASIL